MLTVPVPDLVRSVTLPGFVLLLVNVTNTPGVSETAVTAPEISTPLASKACELFDNHQPCGPEANMSKYLAAKASWEAANVCLQTHGGFGFANEYDVERKFRETRLYQVAPISTNLIYSYIAEHVLGLPRSF